ncbi:MAG TPA: hypothetical protein VL485_16605 [Ktedonobacteraceae bacterium]|jgi:hypothetical protein|nr:hypothetical protein [Ktedonobacteraceae bacterium]
MSATNTAKFSPAWVLFFLAPLLGELLPGISPPFKFINPIASFFLFALYGGGAILCRELTVRTGRGWPTLLALSAVIVLLKEGVMTASLFSPDLAGPLVYGRFLGVNWVWLVQSLLFESIFALAIPILLVHLLFPQRRNEPWIDTIGALWIIGLLLSGLLLGVFFLSPYRPSFVYYLIALAVAAGITVGALNLPYTFRVTKSRAVASPYVFGILSFLGTFVFALITWLLPRSPLPAFVEIAALLALAFYVLKTVLEMSGNAQKWRDSQQAALLSGALAFYVLLAPFKEWFPQGQDMRGMTFVAVGATVFLIGLNWLVRSRNTQQQFVVPTNNK